MSKTRYQYLGEDYTLIRPSTGAPKEKVVNGEIIEIEDGLYEKGRLIMGGFRVLVGKGENAKALEAGNDAVVRENAELAEKKRLEEEEKAANPEDHNKDSGGAVADGLGAPVLEVPGSTPSTEAPVVTTKVEDDGKTDITVVVLDYTTMKQGELKEEMAKRGMEVPAGIVKNETLIDALKADDAKKEEEKAANPSTDTIA